MIFDSKRDSSEWLEASYQLHPIDEIEPQTETESSGSDALIYMLGWIGETKVPTSLAMRAEIVMHSVTPEIWPTTIKSIAHRYKCSSSEVKRMSEHHKGYSVGSEVFFRIFGWMGEAKTTTALSMRTEVVLHTITPQLWDSTAASIASRYQVTRAEISKLAVGLRDAFPSANIQAPTQRNERTRQKCKTAQKKIVESGLRKSWPSRISRLNSQPTAS